MNVSPSTPGPRRPGTPNRLRFGPVWLLLFICVWMPTIGRASGAPPPGILVGPLSNDQLPTPWGLAWSTNRAGRIAIFRPFPDEAWSYLKMKGDLAWTLYRGMTRATPDARDRRRRGVHMLASLDNVVDGPVVEVRFDNQRREMAPYPEDHFALRHDPQRNRHHGEAAGVDEGRAIRVSGGAGVALAIWLGRSTDEVTFDIVSLESGELRVR